MQAVDEYQGAITRPETRPFSEVKSHYKYFQEGDVLFARITPSMENGKAAVARNLIGGIGFGTTEFHVLRSKPTVLPEWIFFYLRRKTFRNEARQHFRGAVGQQRVPDEFLKTAYVPVPPDTRTQRNIVVRVVALLKQIKEARGLVSEMQEDARALLGSAYHEVYSCAQRENWVTRPLKDVADVWNGRISGTGTSTVRVFKTKHIYPPTLLMDSPSYAPVAQESKLSEKDFLRNGDVLMANIAEGTLGRVTFVENTSARWTADTQAMILRAREPDQMILGKWIYYFLWSEHGRREVLNRRTGIPFADQRGQTHIYPSAVREILIPFPSLAKQKQYISYLDSISRLSIQSQGVLREDEERVSEIEQSILERAVLGGL